MSHAKAILQSHWDGNVPVDPVRLASALGVAVVADPGLVEPVRIEVRDGKATITFKSDEPRVRQRYAIAHALGHVVYKHVQDGQAAVDSIANFAPDLDDAHETVANAFAIDLLMPAHIVRYAVNQNLGGNLASLCGRFDVSPLAMKLRLEQLAILRSKPSTSKHLTP